MMKTVEEKAQIIYYRNATFRLPAKLYEAMREAAFERRVSMSEVIRLALGEYLK